VNPVKSVLDRAGEDDDQGAVLRTRFEANPDVLTSYLDTLITEPEPLPVIPSIRSYSVEVRQLVRHIQAETAREPDWDLPARVPRRSEDVTTVAPCCSKHVERRVAFRQQFIDACIHEAEMFIEERLHDADTFGNGFVPLGTLRCIAAATLRKYEIEEDPEILDAVMDATNPSQDRISLDHGLFLSALATLVRKKVDEDYPKIAGDKQKKARPQAVRP
jgi:hypothetical protein